MGEACPLGVLVSVGLAPGAWPFVGYGLLIAGGAALGLIVGLFCGFLLLLLLLVLEAALRANAIHRDIVNLAVPVLGMLLGALVGGVRPQLIVAVMSPLRTLLDRYAQW